MPNLHLSEVPEESEPSPRLSVVGGASVVTSPDDRDDATAAGGLLPSALRLLTSNVLTTTSPTDGGSSLEGGSEHTDIPQSPPLVELEIGDAPVLSLDDVATAKMIAAHSTYADPMMESHKRTSVVKTVIPKGWTFTGQISGEEDMVLECNLVGDVEATHQDASITFGTNSVSEGCITGRSVHMQGRHTGKINAAGGHVCIDGTSRIHGSVIYTSLQTNGGKHRLDLLYVPASGTADSDV